MAKPEESAININLKSIGDNFFQTENPSNKRGHAFECLCASSILNISLEDKEDIISLKKDIVGAGGDKGIDIINIDNQNNEVNILSCCSFGHHNKEQLLKILEGLTWVFEKDKDDYERLTNQNLRTKIENIRINAKNVKRVNVFYCVLKSSSGTDIELDDTKKMIEDFLAKNLFTIKYNSPRNELYLYSSREIFSKKCRNDNPLSKKTLTLNFISQKDLSESNAAEIKGTILTIQGEEIVKLVKDNRDYIFEDNIRGWYGEENKVNDSIRKTILENPKEFWFLNNGITIVCENYSLNSKINNKIDLLYPQIVNGLQTAMSLLKCSEIGKLDKNLSIICRIYKTRDPKKIDKIVDSSNRQTRIDEGDLSANDSMQIAIEECFRDKGYFYKRKKGKKENTELKTVSMKKIGQCSLAVIEKKPSVARIYKNDIIFGSDKEYIFNKEPEDLLKAYLLVEFCKEKNKNIKDKENIEEEIKFFGYLHIARIVWGLLRDDVKIDFLNNQKINLNNLYKKSFKIIKKIILKMLSGQEDIKLASYLNRQEIDGRINVELSKILK